MIDLLPYMTELFPFDNDMKSYNTALSSYYTNDNASSTVSLLFLNTNIGNDNSKMFHICFLKCIIIMKLDCLRLYLKY